MVRMFNFSTSVALACNGSQLCARFNGAYVLLALVCGWTDKFKNMKRLKFYKESDNRWYVDLPEWTGSKAELEMVAGADSMLEYMAEGEGQVWLVLSEQEFENADKLEFLHLANEIENGAFYKLDKYRGIEIGLEMWLCDVTKFVFGDFPKTIFLSATNWS